jgi:hypothetical protein
MNGFGWYNRSLPLVVVQDDYAILRYTDSRYVFFDKAGAAYIPRFKFQYYVFLSYDPIADEFRAFLPDRRIYTFGRLTPGSPGYVPISIVDRNGETISYTYDSSFRIVSVLRGPSGAQSGFSYTYVSTSGLVESVTLKLKDNDVRRVLYTYYSGSGSGGTNGDLKTATTEKWNVANAEWESLGMSYHRYYGSGAPNGFVHGLKFVLEPEAYARMVAASLDPLTATDAELAGYADYYFEYDAEHRVSLETVRGGAYSYRFTYSGNPNPTIAEAPSSLPASLPPAEGEFNSWLTKTVVTQPDNTQEIAYCNCYGQVMLKVFRSHEGEWSEYWRYSDTGQVVLSARPSAVAAYDENLPELVVLHEGHGFVEITDYYTSGGSGGAPGRAKSARVRQGELGSDAFLWERQYVARSAGGDTSYFASKSVNFIGVAGSTNTAESSFAYQWHASTAVFSERTTTLPVIPTTQNGSGIADEFTEEFDTYGNRTGFSDQLGITHEWSWDVALNAITQQVSDVGGLNLTTDYDLDQEGRVVREVGPVHVIDLEGTATSIRRVLWTLYLDSARQVRTAGGFVRTAISEDPGILINPVFIAQHDHAGRTVKNIQAIRSDTEGPLLPGDTFAQSDYTRWSMSHFDDHSNLDFSRVYHDIPASGDGTEIVNYGESHFAYDAAGRLIQNTSPAGTISRSVFNTRGLQTALWIGTDATGARDADPKAGGSSENDLVIVESRQYDRGLPGGDGLLTQSLGFVNASQVRVSSVAYDYRGRRVEYRGENGFRETYVNDNEGHVVMIERWSDQGVSPILTSRDETLFDPLGRTYRTIRHSVDARIRCSRPPDKHLRRIQRCNGQLCGSGVDCERYDFHSGR